MVAIRFARKGVEVGVNCGSLGVASFALVLLLSCREAAISCRDVGLDDVGMIGGVFGFFNDGAVYDRWG